MHPYSIASPKIQVYILFTFKTATILFSKDALVLSFYIPWLHF